MNLDSITAVIRPRESWEAVDLGIALTRRDYSKILRANLLVVWPVWGVLIFLLRDHFWWLLLTLWWTNAAWEKVTLYFISRRLFGGNESIRSFLKDWPRWFWTRLHHSLFMSRFSVDRSLHLPAVMLEGTDGSALSRRVAGLRQYSGLIGAKMATIFFLCLHTCWIQLAIILYWLLPFLSWREVTLLMEGGDSLPESFFWVCLFCYLLVFTLLTPFYVGAGFGMYLNARTKMEGWDVELVFRRMARRIGAAAVCLLLGLSCLANGQEAERDPKKVMENVLNDDAFVIHTRTEKKYVNRKDKSRSGPGLEGIPSRRGAGIGSGFDATFLGWIAIGAVGIYVLFLLGRMLLAKIGSGTSGDEPKAETVLGLRVSRESLPKDLITKARELWGSGDTRESLALLYRGSLSWLIYNGGISIRESDTEIDCLDRAGKSESGMAHIDYFRALTSAWIKVAYGKEELSKTEMQFLLDDWPFEKRKIVPAKPVIKTAVLILFTSIFTGCGNVEVEEETREIGYKGRARVYPFLAVERFFNEMSVDFERIYTLTEMPATSSVILFPSEADNRKERAEALLEWVSNGGSVVYLLKGADSFERWIIEENKQKLDRDKAKKNKDVSYRFLEKLGVNVVDTVADNHKANWGKRTYQWELDNSPGFETPVRIWKGAKNYRIGESRKAVSAIQFKHGDGFVTLVGQAKPWRNRHVGEGDHASVLWDILNRGKEKLESVWLVRGSRVSFWDLLLKYAWMPLLSLAVYILIWLWKSIPRFGPLIPDRVEGTRDFHEHLLMTGRFFVRHDLTVALIEPAQKRLARKLKRFNLTGEGASAADWTRLSDTIEIPEENLRRALDPSRKPASRKEYSQTIRILQKIDQKL